MAAGGASSAGEDVARSRAYTTYVVAIIWCVLLLRFVDLQIVAALAEPIRAEFDLSDTQLGLLIGFAFALFYGTLGLPVAWLADRYNRRNIIAASLGLWSLMTAACGMAGGYLSLFLARVGVGIGEAGGVPPSYSLISDYVEEKRRPMVFAFLNTAVPIGVFAGLLIGGWVSELIGWRAAFFVVGAPGVVLALVVRFTLREPPRSAPPAEGMDVRATFGFLWGQRAYVHLVLASTILSLGATGSGSWIPSFFIRTHGMGVAEADTFLAFIYGGGGLVGALAGGALCERLRARTGDARWNARLPAITTLLILPTAFGVYLWPSAGPALMIHIVGVVLLHAWMGPCYATIQSLAGARRRAMAAALNLLLINLIAYSLGPTIIGIISDALSPELGVHSLRYAILGVVLVSYAWAALHFLLAARTLRADLTQSAEPAS